MSQCANKEEENEAQENKRIEQVLDVSKKRSHQNDRWREETWSERNLRETLLQRLEERKEGPIKLWRYFTLDSESLGKLRCGIMCLQ